MTVGFALLLFVGCGGKTSDGDEQTGHDASGEGVDGWSRGTRRCP